MAYKILIVDDEEMLTELLSSHLQDCGYTTFVAKNAEQALSMLSAYPDLILLDINMPEWTDWNYAKLSEIMWFALFYF